jgi:G3E family GTPase
VIINKTDLIPDAELSALQNEIINMNGVASIRHATFGRVDLDFVLDLRAYAMDSDILRDKMHRLESSHHHPDKVRLILIMTCSCVISARENGLYRV